MAKGRCLAYRRARTGAALTQVVSFFGEALPHKSYLFAKRSANRMKVLVHGSIDM